MNPEFDKPELERANDRAKRWQITAEILQKENASLKSRIAKREAALLDAAKWIKATGIGYNKAAELRKLVEDK